MNSQARITSPVTMQASAILNTGQAPTSTQSVTCQPHSVDQVAERPSELEAQTQAQQAGRESLAAIDEHEHGHANEGHYDEGLVLALEQPEDAAGVEGVGYPKEPVWGRGVEKGQEFPDRNLENWSRKKTTTAS